jgi:hypothetical protein
VGYIYRRSSHFPFRSIVVENMRTHCFVCVSCTRFNIIGAFEMWVFYLRRIHTEMNVWMGRGGGAAADTAMVVINRKLLTN